MGGQVNRIKDIDMINVICSDTNIIDTWIHNNLMIDIRSIDFDPKTYSTLFIEYKNETYIFTPNYTWYKIKDNKTELIDCPKFIYEYKALKIKCNKGNCKHKRGNECAKCNRVYSANQITLRFGDYSAYLGHGEHNKFCIVLEYTKLYKGICKDELLQLINCNK